MESAKLKNIILTILIITNILLLGLVVSQRMESRQQRRQAIQDVEALLTQQGITVRAEDLPGGEFPAPLALKQDPDAQEKTFSALLGEDTTFTQRGLVGLYNGPLGQAEVRENGEFTVELVPGAYPLDPDQSLQDHAGTVLTDQMGFSCQILSVRSNAVTVTQTWEGWPVFSCQTTLSYRGGELASIKGTGLFGVPTADPQAGEPLDISTLLVRFRAGIIDSGDACTAIHAATQGYVLSADLSGALRLTPVLRLETDTNLYVVNALNGDLSRG